MSSASNPLRQPDLRSAPLMHRRAWWLVGMNFLIPGSAQVLAGNRKLGRLGLAATLVSWALALVAVVAALIWREQFVIALATPLLLWLIAGVLVIFGALWLLLTLDTLRLVRFVRLQAVVRAGIAALAVAALMVSCFVSFGGAWMSASVAVVAAKVGENTVDLPGGAVGAVSGPVNILLAGSDSGDGNPIYGPRGEALNDVTILVHLSPASHSATVVSIPRDLWVKLPACNGSNGKVVAATTSPMKFNQSLPRGGLACIAAGVTSITGISIQYGALIQFDGVVAMSDALGGVEVCVQTPINDPLANLNIPAGEQTLQGADALGFLRTRHGLAGGGDLQRISNQQVFLSALARKLKDGSTLSDPSKLLALANAALDHMQLTKSLASTSTLVSLAQTLRGIPLANISFVQYPVVASYVHGQSVVLPVASAAKVLNQAIIDDRPVAAGGLGSAASTSAPAAAASAAPGAAKASAAPSASSGSSAPSSPSGKSDAAVQLPSAVTGQSASQQTCSRGSG